MTTVPVQLGDRGYEVVIERGLLARAAALMPGGRPMPIVVDEGALPHLATLQAALGSLAGVAIVLPAGEATKSWSQLAALVDRLLALGVERGDHVIALGGGVVGDLVGFATAVLKRGCGVVQVPTTLLAQVDSSVGGKTGINTAAGKNLVGAVHQPALVLIDPDVLATLPARQLAAGYAEVVKYGLIDDPAFFAWCEEHGAALLAGDVAAREHAIAHAVAAKARIVAADEYETSGTRALLNLGHTFGHALEAAASFGERLLHGEAVAAGCTLAFDYSARCGLCPAEDAERVTEHFGDVGLPVGLAGTDASTDELIALMRHDKKASGGRLPFLFARGIGRTFLDRDVDLADVAAFLAERR